VKRASAGPRLDERTLRLTLLERQGLLERRTVPIPEAIEAAGGLQTQYAPSGYVGLWTRLDEFRRNELTVALEDRSVVQATLMRTTIHMVARDRFWHYALGVRQARRTWALRRPGVTERDLVERAERLREALRDGPRTVRELGELGAGFVGDLGLWVDLVRVPPSGTWQRRRADRLALAEDWVGPPPPDVDEPAGLRHLVRTYLHAFGPAPWRDIAAWAGVGLTELRSAAADLDLQPYADVQGRPLVDLAGLDLADPDAPAPVRFVPHWDALLLVHARRTGVLPEAHRPRVFSSKNPFSVGTVLVDGRVMAGWSIREGRLEVDPFEAIPRSVAAELERERQALEAFHA
jgi:hypothetical protein